MHYSVRELKKQVRKVHNPTQAANAFLVHMFLKQEEQQQHPDMLEKFGTHVELEKDFAFPPRSISDMYAGCTLQLFGEGGFKTIPLPGKYPDPFWYIMYEFKDDPKGVWKYAHTILKKDGKVIISPLSQMSLIALQQKIESNNRDFPNCWG
jgi:hypothetical protein